MKIVKSTEPMPVAHPIFHIIGDPGLGKTTILGTADSPLLLDFDGGSHRCQNRPDTVRIGTWQDVADLTREPDALSEYQTIGVDTTGRCIDILALDIIRAEPKLGRDGSLSQQGWGKLKQRFRSWATDLRSLGKDIVLLSHAKEEKDGDTRVVRADVSGGSYAEIMRVADFVGYLTMAGKDRLLDFNPTDRYVGKNPAGWKALVVPHYAKDPRFLANLIAEGRAAIGRISESSAKAVGLIIDWEAKFSEATDADSLNALLPAVKEGLKAEPAIVVAQVREKLAARATALGLESDKAKGLYVPKAEEKAKGKTAQPAAVGA